MDALLGTPIEFVLPGLLLLPVGWFPRRRVSRTVERRAVGRHALGNAGALLAPRG